MTGFVSLSQTVLLGHKEHSYQFTLFTGWSNTNPFPLLVTRREQKPELKKRIELFFLEKVRREKKKELNKRIAIFPLYHGTSLKEPATPKNIVLPF